MDTVTAVIERTLLDTKVCHSLRKIEFGGRGCNAKVGKYLGKPLYNTNDTLSVSFSLSSRGFPCLFDSK